jgi:MFS family permease
LGTALSLIGDSTLYAVLPTHTNQAGIALASVGIILSANRLIRLVFNSLAGSAYDRLPRRGLFVMALFIGSLSTALYSVRGFWSIMTGRLLWGLAWSGIWVGGAAIILDISSDLDRGRLMGAYQTWFFLGAGFGALLGGILTDWLGYQIGMLVSAFLTAAGGLVALLFLPETRPLPTRAESQRPLSSSWGWLRHPGLWVSVTVQAINRFAIAGVLVATTALLVEEYLNIRVFIFGLGTMTGLLVAGRMLMSTLSAPLGGAFSDRLGNRWLVTLFSAILAALSMFLISRSTTLALVSGLLGSAAASGVLQTLTTALVGEQVEHYQRGRAIGLLHTLGDLGSAIGPLTGYALLPWVGLNGLYLLCAGLFLVGAILIEVFRRTRKLTEL